MDTRRFPKKPARSESLRIGNRTVQRGKAGNGRNAAGLYRVSNEDRSVSPVNSVLYYEALHKHRIPAELHIFPEGPHGFGLKTDFPYHDEMVASLARWLREINAGKFSAVR